MTFETSARAHARVATDCFTSTIYIWGFVRPARRVSQLLQNWELEDNHIDYWRGYSSVHEETVIIECYEMVCCILNLINLN